MYLQSLELTNFRNYKFASTAFPSEGLTVIVGQNGQGKTNLLEAIAFAANLRSFRTHDTSALVGKETESAVIRSGGFRNQRQLDIDIELSSTARTRVFVNKQPVRRNRDLDDALSATVFFPEDLQLVKGGPGERRRFIDELLGDSSLSAAALLRDLDRITKQRNTLLKQAGGRLSVDVESTLDVWDAQLTDKGEQLGRLRAQLVQALQPLVLESYKLVADQPDSAHTLTIRLATEWSTSDGFAGLAQTLAETRKVDVARGLTTKGPHRDEVEVAVNTMPARTHASQGEQRTLALALRLAGHRYMTDRLGAPPILLLDDVFSELDVSRVRGLIDSLPTGQTFVTTASPVPEGIIKAAELHIRSGAIS